MSFVIIFGCFLGIVLYNQYMDKRTLIWRIASVAICLILFCSYATKEIIAEGGFPYDINASRLIIPAITFFIVMVLLVIFPYQFYIHAAACWLFGFVLLIDGGRLNALLLHLLGYLFLYRQGFFIKRARIKLIIGSLLLLFVIITQLRFGLTQFKYNISYYTVILTTLVVTYFLLLPEINIIKNHKDEKILYLPSDNFKKRDVMILEKIINGDKYEVIASDLKIPMSTLTRRIHNLFLKLQVSGQRNFISKYANHKIKFNAI